MNVYDFDKTIYRGDSTVDFWRHCLRRYPGAARALPGTLAKALAFRQGRCSREQFKERFYQFLRFVPEAAQEAERFLSLIHIYLHWAWCSGILAGRRAVGEAEL